MLVLSLPCIYRNGICINVQVGYDSNVRLCLVRLYSSMRGSA